MSTDVADLGLKVDSTQVKDASKDLDQMERSGKKAAESTDLFTQKWLDLVKGLAVYDILKKVASSLLETAEMALLTGERYAKLASIAGTTAAAISAFEEPSRKSGVAIETVALSISRLSRAIGEARLGDQSQKLTLNALGISPNDSRDAAAIFLDVSRALINMKDQTLANAVAFPLLGRGMSELKPFMKELIEQGQLHARITEEQAKQSKELADTWAELKLEAENATLALTSKLVPALTSMLKLLLDIKKNRLSNLDLQSLAGGVPLDFDQRAGASQADVRALDNAQLGGSAAGPSADLAQANIKKLEEDRRLYESRISALKGFNDQYATYVKALSALIEADGDQSVNAQEHRLEKQNALQEDALRKQIALAEKERALALGVGKVKEAEDYRQAVAQAQAQIVANEIITNAKITAIREENLKKGLEAERNYVAAIEQQGADLATTQREAEDRAYEQRLKALEVFLKANQDLWAKGEEARKRLLEQYKTNILAISQDEWKNKVLFAQFTNRDLLAINQYMFGALANLMNSGSRRMFEIGKLASEANAVITTYEAANSAYAAGAKIGGPFLGAAFAAAAIAAGIVNVQRIHATQFGSGSVGGGATSFAPGVGVPVTPSGPTVPPVAPAPAAGASVIIQIQGNLVGNEDFVRNTLLPIIREAVGDEDHVLIPLTSRQAADLSTLPRT